MRIYRTVPAEGFESALPVNDADFAVFRGETSGEWPVPEMYLLRAEGRQTYRRADLPWLRSDAIVLRDEAIDVIAPLLAPHGALLPLACADARLQYFRAVAVAGVLNTERSQIVRFPTTGRAMTIPRPAFKESLAAKNPVFTLPEVRGGHLYLTESIVHSIRATGLTSGTNFELVYDSGSI